MSVPVRLAAFAVAAAVAFGLGFGLGDVAGPFDDAPTRDLSPPDGDHDGHPGTGEEGT